MKLPESIEDEEVLIGQIVLDPNILDFATEQLDADDFQAAKHRAIWRKFQAVYRDHGDIDSHMLLEKLTENERSHVEYLMECVETTASADHHIKRIKDIGLMRLMITTLGTLLHESQDWEEDAKSFANQVESRLLSVPIERSGRSNLVKFSKIANEAISDVTKNPEPGLKSGFLGLDAITNGFKPGELTIIAGRPSMGKTTFAMNVVESFGVKNNKSVALFSLEVEQKRLALSLIAQMSEVDSRKIEVNQLTVSNWEDITLAFERIGGAPIYICDDSMITVDKIRMHLRRMKSKHGLDAVVIDYLQLMGDGSSRIPRHQEIANISRGLKQLAKEFNIPVIALSQLSRGVEQREDKRPRMADLRESGAIEQDADVVLLLYRAEYYYPEQTKHWGEAELIIGKQRHGKTGSVKLQFIGEKSKFKDVEYEDM